MPKDDDKSKPASSPKKTVRFAEDLQKRVINDNEKIDTTEPVKTEDQQKHSAAKSAKGKRQGAYRTNPKPKVSIPPMPKEFDLGGDSFLDSSSDDDDDEYLDISSDDDKPTPAGPS